MSSFIRTGHCRLNKGALAIIRRIALACQLAVFGVRKECAFLCAECVAGLALRWSSFWW
jgi:hypothetical protein